MVSVEVQQVMRQIISTLTRSGLHNGVSCPMSSDMLNRIALLAALVIGTSACASGSVTITNQSDFTIVEMHVTETTNISWGPNLLAGNVLLPGEQTTVSTACANYDIMLVDSTNVSCEIDNIDLCLNNADFVIYNNTCTAFRKAAAAQNPTAPTSK